MLAIYAARITFPKRSRPSQNGFSLLEIMIVLTILSAVSVLSIISFTAGKDRLELDSLAGTIRAAFTQARNIALTTGEPARVEFSIDPMGLQILSDALEEKVLDRQGFGSAPVFLDTQDRSQISPGPVYFYADGQSSGLAMILSLAGRERIISVDWLTGKTTIKRQINNG